MWGYRHYIILWSIHNLVNTRISMSTHSHSHTSGVSPQEFSQSRYFGDSANYIGYKANGTKLSMGSTALILRTQEAEADASP